MSISQLTTNDRLRAAQAASALRSNAAYAAPATQAPTRQPDAVSLSDSARALSAARNAVASATEVREDRVGAIKAALASGTYKVDSRQLAHALLQPGVI